MPGDLKKKRPAFTGMKFLPEQIQVSQLHVYNYQKTLWAAQMIDGGGIGITAGIGRRTVAAMSFEDGKKDYENALIELLYNTEHRGGLNVYFSRVDADQNILHMDIPERVMRLVRSVIYISPRFNLVRYVYHED